MLYSYNFSVENLSKLIQNNIDNIGNVGRQSDAEIIYYYLSQKYGFTGTIDVLNNLLKIMDKTSVEINEMMLRLSNDD